MGRELPGGKIASQWEESFPVGRELPSGRAKGAFQSKAVSQIPVRREFFNFADLRKELLSGKGASRWERASQWEVSSPVVRELSSGKAAS